MRTQLFGMTMVLVLAMSAAAAAATPLRTVATFDLARGETPENLVVAGDGTVYVSLAFASAIRRIAPDGRQTSVAIPTAGGITVGLAIARPDARELYVAVRSPDAEAAGIWEVSLPALDDPHRVAALPADAFPNGMAFDARGGLYVADSALGVIWRLDPGAAAPAVWCEGPLLAPTGEAFMGFPLPGANGIKVRDRVVYVSNTATRQILAAPIRRDGSAGALRVRHAGIEADDFDFTPDGDLIVAENPPNALVRVTADGTTTTLATAADGLDNPSAVALAARRELYVTNAAYFGTRPSLAVMTLPAGRPLSARSRPPRHGPTARG